MSQAGQTRRFSVPHQIVEAAARSGVDSKLWDYLITGSETETTLRRNRHAIDSLALLPRVLRNVRQIDASTDFFGRKVRLPVILAPVGAYNYFHPEGAIGVAEAGGRFGVPMFVSVPMEGVLEAVGGIGERKKRPSSNEFDAERRSA